MTEIATDAEIESLRVLVEEGSMSGIFRPGQKEIVRALIGRIDALKREIASMAETTSVVPTPSSTDPRRPMSEMW